MEGISVKKRKNGPKKTVLTEQKLEEMQNISENRHQRKVPTIQMIPKIQQLMDGISVRKSKSGPKETVLTEQKLHEMQNISEKSFQCQPWNH